MEMVDRGVSKLSYYKGFPGVLKLLAAIAARKGQREDLSASQTEPNYFFNLLVFGHARSRLSFSESPLLSKVIGNGTRCERLNRLSGTVQMVLTLPIAVV